MEGMGGILNFEEATELNLSLLVLSRNLGWEQGSGHIGCVMEREKKGHQGEGIGKTKCEAVLGVLCQQTHTHSRMKLILYS